MKQRDNYLHAFTLIESVMVLAVASLIVGMAVFFRPAKPKLSVYDFERSLGSSFEHSRAQAQTEGTSKELRFEKHMFFTSDSQLTYPQDYHLKEERTIKIQASGFVSPQSIVFYHSGKALRFIIQFGGGHYHFQE